MWGLRTDKIGTEHIRGNRWGHSYYERERERENDVVRVILELLVDGRRDRVSWWLISAYRDKSELLVGQSVKS